MNKPSILPAALCLCLCLLVPGIALAADFTADMTQTLDGKTINQGKAFVKDGKVRLESTMRVERQVVISDPRTGRMIMIKPEQKVYMEARVAPASSGQDIMSGGKSDKGQWRTVGRETVEGFECEKRVFDFKDKGQGELTGWFAVTLDYPIKTVFSQGSDSMSVEYKNIKAGPLDDSLFEAPRGYQKMSAPAPGQAPGPAPGQAPGK